MTVEAGRCVDYVAAGGLLIRIGSHSGGVAVDVDNMRPSVLVGNATVRRACSACSLSVTFHDIEHSKIESLQIGQWNILRIKVV